MIRRLLRVAVATLAMAGAAGATFALMSYTLLPIDIHSSVLWTISLLVTVAVGASAAVFVLRRLYAVLFFLFKAFRKPGDSK